MATDYGPIPISQFKAEAGRIFDALADGRRVLISRYGRVVAAISPASAPEHAPLMADFAVDYADSLRELNASDIAQGSPSESIRLAERGVTSLLTRNSKVFGVISGHTTGQAVEDPDQQEKLLEKFEADHPDATPAEFAQAVAHVTAHDAVGSAERSPSAARSVYAALLHGVAGATPDEKSERRLLSDALIIRGFAFERAEHLIAARNTFEKVVELFENDGDPFVERRVTQAMLELARLHAVSGTPAAALDLTTRVVAALDFDGELALSSSQPLESA
ncbi:hypothetical protein G7072_11245 [Nocardioides sp. HDW12B]|uniref:hypothetical protein n=1 Tax=Nocardioides sp. HDW12B TaxID=2714939 RepID=UPI0014089C71|nr:hypothetical protein [Nocardioides sp. HDW12B]QIK66840.1 hypothetical protein G7072_11245 [Nocardioides sp. HDW12B]